MSTESVKHLFLLTVTDLAEVIKTKDSTLSERLKNHPEDFPPAMEIPGCRGFRFHPQDVADWLVELSAKALGLRSQTQATSVMHKKPRSKPVLSSDKSPLAN
ncbi:MAG: hypothetical protein AB7C98_00590 [Acidithiobacillus sp.]|jgi:hypothetical protein